MSYTLKHHIGLFENFIEDDWCDDVLKFFRENSDEHQRREDYWSSKFDYRMKTKAQDTAINLDQFADHSNKEIADRAKALCSHMAMKFGPAYEHYVDSITLERHNFKIDCFKHQRTLPGEGYHIWHIEYPLFVPHEDDRPKGEIPNMLTRIAVYTLYLNDVEEGGETEFLHQHMRLKPKKGTLCIFPSGITHLHRGNPPLKGEKHIMTGWVNVLPAPQSERKLQEELTQARS